MESRKWWSEAEEEELKAGLKKRIMDVFKRAESMKRYPLSELFSDVYGGEEPWNIVSFFLPQILFARLTLETEGTTGRAWSFAEEVWR